MGRWRAAALTLSRIATKPKSTDPNSPANPPRRFADFASSASAPIFRLLNLKSFSAVPWPSPLYIDEFECNPVDFAQSPKPKAVEESGKIPIKAYFLSTSIDLKSLQAEHFRNVIPPASRSSNYTVLRFRNFPLSTAIGIGENADCFHHMVVFQYGSAVLFNVDDDEAECYLQTVRRYATGLLREMKKDDYAVKEKPSLVEDMEGCPDYIVLKNLDTDSIRVISSVLGQSIALDYFVSQIDGMVEEFANINREMERTGNFTMDRKKLFQLVGKANSNLADVILKVGLFERSEIAWRDAKYAQILEYLSEEYEVTQCFANLNFKLKFVEIHHFDSIDLKSLQAEHFRNVIPPASRSSNYTVLRSRNFPLSTGCNCAIELRRARQNLKFSLVGDSDQKLADGIPLYSIACVHSKPAIFGPLITEHAKRGKCIVFTQTKRDVDRLAYAMQRSHGCEALHGDISQN